MTYAFINNPQFQNENEELKSVYNKWLQRQFGKRLPIHVFGSGSEGNSVYLKPYRTLIDLGLPYKRYEEYNPMFFLDVDYIILTHHHNDHLNPSTLHRILKNYPHIKIILHQFMWEYITSDYFKPKYIKREPNEIVPFGHDPMYKTDANGRRIIQPSGWREKFYAFQSRFNIFTQPMAYPLQTHDMRPFTFEPFTTKHGDILNVAIRISDPTLQFEFLYASDLDNLGGERSFVDCFGRNQYVTGLPQNRHFTCVFLEANYDEQILQQFYASLTKDDPNYYRLKARADGNLRHISEQETSAYIQKFLLDDGLFVPLHASKTFGTLHQT